jgi:hypothetical protein
MINRIGTKWYACFISNLNITEPNVKITTKGEHLQGKSNKDVSRITFEDSKVHYFPLGISELFPNLTSLEIIECGLKMLKKKDFLGLENLKYVWFNNNELEYLSGDLFAMLSIKSYNLTFVFKYSH